MTSPSHEPDQQPPERTFEDVLHARTARRRSRIQQEIARNRQGGHRLPTWVLAVVLGLLLLGWAYLLIFD